MATQTALAGLALAAVGLTGRALIPIARAIPKDASKLAAMMPKMPTFDFKVYDKGGFKDEMTKQEAARILGVGLSSPVNRIKDAHRRLMLSGIHPDKGGSAYMTTKINEAKDLLVKSKKRDS